MTEKVVKVAEKPFFDGTRLVMPGEIYFEEQKVKRGKNQPEDEEKKGDDK